MTHNLSKEQKENTKALLNLKKRGIIDFEKSGGITITNQGLDILEAFLLLDTYNEAKAKLDK